jgi:8-oxo-dGTP pyrophosphatase MutT (NUDIX family)
VTSPAVPARAPIVPRPAASALLVRPGRGSPLEVFMIRRQQSMRFLGGYYAFPGGAVDPADRTPGAFARCRGLTGAEAERAIPSEEGLPALAFWVAAARELLEETGVLFGSDSAGRALDARDAAVAPRVGAMREALLAGAAPLHELLAREGWWLELGPLRYLSHFITPPSSPIRFTARFFLAPLPDGQAVQHFEEEAAEAFWIDPREGYRRFRLSEMPMAEPADCGLAYLSQFESLEALWAAHVDGRHKFHGILDRVEAAGVDPRRTARRRPC